MRPGIRTHAYVAVGESTSPRFCRAFAEGSHGRIVEDGVLRPGPVAMFGSPKLWDLLDQAKAAGQDFYYGDHAYFGRGEYYRVTKNALQHTGYSIVAPDEDRFKVHGIEIKPWRQTGSHIIICPQSDSFMERHGLDPVGWRVDVMTTIRKYSDRPVKFRTKANTLRGHTLAMDLVDAWAVVAFTSNAAVEAVLAGVPAFALGQCAASAMTLSDLKRIEDPIYPDGRDLWAWTLADNQWTLEEIRSGACWRAIQ